MTGTDPVRDWGLTGEKNGGRIPKVMAKVPQVDKETCIGCGTCTVIAPEVFELGEDGKARVKLKNEETEKLKNKIQEAVDNCPVSAIKWQED